ncbi:predicted protein [Histoplasma capsulatum H143]|uniref:Uncharacterized protein n=1 Tax=Ajellomyces capsulatus (strain H143) TaxID=544712 RepID=C6HPZ0_AJECH|nr:predicted protein [Histoplasma capsulatum H143]
MLVSHSSDELPYRRVWLESREFEDDLKAYAANGLDDELRAASNAAFAMAYYKQPVRKGWASLILSFWLPTVLHITGTCTSDVFIKSVQQRDVAPLILLVLGMVMTSFSLWYQREDNHKPGVGVKFLHGLGSLVVTGLNAALAAYILGTARGKPDLRAAISSIVMAIVSLYASAGSFLLLLKGVAGNLAEATWADYFDLSGSCGKDDLNKNCTGGIINSRIHPSNSLRFDVALGPSNPPKAEHNVISQHSISSILNIFRIENIQLQGEAKSS